jgi:ribonuclease-3
MNPYDDLKFKLAEIEEKLQISFCNKELLLLAFVHRSILNEEREIRQHNERLEFLGDSVLNLAVTEYLYKKYEDFPEGKLSFLRALLVSSASCAKWMEKLGLGSYILLGKGEQEQARGKETILADTFEAVLGAIFLDSSFEEVKKFLFLHFETDFLLRCQSPAHNYKADLQDLLQKMVQKIPSYQVVEETGPSHAKVFQMKVCLDAQELGLGLGYSKKEAEQSAAKEALKRLELSSDALASHKQ